MKLAEMCRKLETEEEKVLPFYAASLSPEEEEQVASIEAEPPVQAIAQVHVCKYVTRKDCDVTVIRMWLKM